MSTEGLMDVEVPIHAISVVEDGNVYEAEDSHTDYVACWCTNGKHPIRERTRPANWVPHLAAVTTVKYTWTPPEKVDTPPRVKKARPHQIEDLVVATVDIGLMPK